MNVNIAIIAASGKGTRFRPVTSVLSKEMLPINGVPAIQYSVNECIAAGIKKICIIVRKEDDLILKYFMNQPFYKDRIVTDFSDEEDNLEIMIHNCSLPQKGNAMPVLEMRKYLADKCFAVLFADDVIFETNPIHDLLTVSQDAPNCASVILYTEVESSEVRHYGNILIDDTTKRISKLVQKPNGYILSNYVIISRILLTPEIFSYLDLLDDEKDIGVALGLQCKTDEVIGCMLRGVWVSVDSPIKYANAVSTALKYLN